VPAKQAKMMKSVLLFVLLLVNALAFTEFEYQSAFTFWMQQYQKSYSHEEFQHRYKTFRQNMDFIERKNKENLGFTVAMNQFGDLSSSEFANLYLGTRIKVAPVPVVPTVRARAPVSWDWRTKGAVTAIKNQGQCGSCWSFSTTGSTEGCHFLTTGKLVSLSEQNLMDCSTSQGNQGCNGGLMTQAMDYIISNKGIDTEASYPYTAQDGTCNYNPANSGATLTSYTNVNTGDENDLLAKAAMGPTSVAIDASQNSFQFYSSGVYNETACSTSQLDHGVLVAGWGVSNGTPYWLVKNSWGTSWGLAGYIWMSRNNGNQCGIATMATLPQC
jgi:cathepsin L